MDGEKDYKAHVVVLAFPGQGHINALLQFSKRLAYKGFKITVTTSLSYTKMLQVSSGSMLFEHIYDDLTEGGAAGPGGYKGFKERFEARGLANLAQLIRRHESSEYPVKCLVYDANLQWASSLVKQLGILSAAFFTQSCSAIACYYPMYCEWLEKPLPTPAFPVNDLPKLGVPHLPSLGPNTGRFSPIIQQVLSPFITIGDADWVLFNSFDSLEETAVKWMSNLWPVRTIGPCIPSVYLDKRVPNDNNYGFSLYDPGSDACMEWLNRKKKGSVIYVSFGSVTYSSEEIMAQMAMALKQNNYPFLWVVRTTEVSKLPKGFVEETSVKGLVVSWCPQLAVLEHEAVGCFVSHCGWNSTIEAISFGVPIVALPQFLDQMTNAHFVEQIWEVAVKPTTTDEKGFPSGEEIGRCIWEVMEGERGEVMRLNCKRWKELATEAIEEGGSSDNHIEDIVARIMSS